MSVSKSLNVSTVLVHISGSQGFPTLKVEAPAEGGQGDEVKEIKEEEEEEEEGTLLNF